MDTDTSLIIAGISLVFGIYQGITSINRSKTTDERNAASQMSMVIIKLETIGIGITEIKSELCNVKTDIKEDRERIVKVEEAAKMAHKRLDICEQFCKRVNTDNNV